MIVRDVTPMRILYLTPETWPTFRVDVAALFGKYLPRHGIYSDLVTGRTPGQEGSVEWGGGEAFLCDVTGGQAKKYLKIVLHGIQKLFGANSSRYDAIQVRDMPELAVIGLIAAWIKRLPFYYWMSYPTPEGLIELAQERGLSAGLMKFLFPWVRGRVCRFLLYRVVLPRANHVFVQSERMRLGMIARGVKADRMTPVPMGVDLEDMHPEAIAPADDPRLANRRVLVYLGTLVPPRRIEFLFDMLAQVRRQMPEALLVLVGDTDDDVHRDWLKRQAEKAGVAEHVIWTGWLPMREGWRYLKACEVGLSPLPRGFLFDISSPTKVLEYLAMGVPVVCNDSPDQQRVIEESTGGLCVPYSASEFADAVVKILKLENKARLEMSERGISYVAEHRDYGLLAGRLASVYQLLSLERRKSQVSLP